MTPRTDQRNSSNPASFRGGIPSPAGARHMSRSPVGEWAGGWHDNFIWKGGFSEIVNAFKPARDAGVKGNLDSVVAERCIYL